MRVTPTTRAFVSGLADGLGGGQGIALRAWLDMEALHDVPVHRLIYDGALAGELGGPITALSWKEREAALKSAAMLINATNQGMVGEPPLDLALDQLPVSALVSDIVYIPRETALLAAARKRGNRTVNGLGMLLHQARPAFHAWFGIMPEVTPELRAMIEATT